MLELNSIAEFSRCYCIAICAFLVPTHLVLACTTMWLVALERSTKQIYTAVSLSVIAATIMLLHVATWWAIGVVMLPTFILPTLALTCLAIDIYAVVNPQQMRHLLLFVFKFSLAKYQQLVLRGLNLPTISLK